MSPITPAPEETVSHSREIVYRDARTDRYSGSTSGRLHASECHESYEILGKSTANVACKIGDECREECYATTVYVGEWTPKRRSDTLDDHIYCDRVQDVLITYA